MPSFQITLEEPAWPDLAGLPPDQIIHYRDAIQATCLTAGMESGAAAVAFRFDLPDGRTLIAETSLAVLNATVRALVARVQPDLNDVPDHNLETAFRILHGLLPAGYGIATHSDRRGAVAAVLNLDESENTPPTHTGEGPTITEAVDDLARKVLVDIARHEAEGHDGAKRRN